jgi:Tfp pilus assembly protein PilX
MLRRTRFIDRLGQVRGFLIVVLLAVLVVTLVALALTRDVRGR